MPEGNKSSQMTPTQRVKRRDRVPRGGPPPVIRDGPVNQPNYPGPLQPGTQPGVQPGQGIPLHQAVNPTPTPQEGDVVRQGRSPQEIKADLERLNNAVKSYNEANPKESNEDKPEEEVTDPTVDEEGGGVDASDAWLFSESGDILNNYKVRKRIEKGLTKLSVEDLILHGEVVQDVILIKNKDRPNRPKLWITFRSVSGMEDLAVKKMFHKDDDEQNVSDRYLIDKYSLMNLCIGLKAVNGRSLTHHLDEKGDFDEDAFARKYREVSKMAQQLLSFLVINYFWFDERVRKTLVTEELGNG